MDPNLSDLRRFLELLGRYPALAATVVFAGLTIGVILGFRVVGPFIFS